MAQYAAKLATGQNYAPPNHRAALILDTYHGACSAKATAKGFYLSAFLRETASNGQHLEGYGPYRDFKDYPQQEAIRLIAECARRLYPDAMLREGIRRIGWSVFPTLLSTMIGKVVFGALGDSIPAVARNASRGFSVSLNGGTCEALRVSANEAELRVEDCFLFPDCFLVGVFEGAVAHYGKDAQVEVANVGKGRCDYLIRW